MIVTKRRRKARRLDSIDLSKQLARSEMPSGPTPMLCTLVAEPFDNAAWIFEPKFDGLRVLGMFDGRDLTLLSRNQASQNFQFPEIARSLITWRLVSRCSLLITTFAVGTVRLE